MTPDDIIPKSLHVTNFTFVLAQNLPPFSKSLVPSANQLQNTSSYPNHTLPSSTSTTQCSVAHCKTFLWNSSSVAPPHPFYQHDKLQCDSCGTWVTWPLNVQVLPSYLSSQQYIKAHPEHADHAATTWKNLHSTNHCHAVFPSSSAPLPWWMSSNCCFNYGYYCIMSHSQKA